MSQKKIVVIAVVDEEEKDSVNLGASAVHIEMSCGASFEEVGVALVDIAAQPHLRTLWDLYKEKADATPSPKSWWRRIFR